MELGSASAPDGSEVNVVDLVAPALPCPSFFFPRVMAGSLRQFAFVGTAVAVTGGVAYALWRNYLSGQEPPGCEDQQSRLRLGVQEEGTGPPAGQVVNAWELTSKAASRAPCI